ncbi:MAG: hypothetical protein ACREDH_14980 [Methylocella sp.]
MRQSPGARQIARPMPEDKAAATRFEGAESNICDQAHNVFLRVAACGACLKAA